MKVKIVINTYNFPWAPVPSPPASLGGSLYPHRPPTSPKSMCGLRRPFPVPNCVLPVPTSISCYTPFSLPPCLFLLPALFPRVFSLPNLVLLIHNPNTHNFPNSIRPSPASHSLINFYYS